MWFLCKRLPGKKGAKALAMENLEASADEQKYFDYTVKLPVKEDVIAKFKEATVKAASSNSLCLSSLELVQDVVKHLTLN